MILTVWKYPIPDRNRFELMLPEGAEFLSVQEQHGVVQSWWLVEPTRELKRRHFHMYGTGHEIDLSKVFILKFLGTFFRTKDGDFVFHLFEDRQPPQTAATPQGGSVRVR